MRTNHHVALYAALVGAALGCSSQSAPNANPSPAGAPANPPGNPGAAPAPSPTPTTMFRVAHLMPDQPPLDLCVAAHGTSAFKGPLLKAAGVGDAGLAYTQATKYLSLVSGQYDVRVVDGDAISCTVGRFDATNLPALRPSESVTIAALGLAHAQRGNELVVYVDDASTAPGPVGLRFIHASPDTPAVDAGFGSGNQFTVLFANVAYAAVGAAGASDGNGYAMIPPPPTAPLLTVRVHDAADDALTFTPPAAPARGDTVTAFLIGDFAGAPAPLKALVCVDNAAAAGGLAACAVRP